MIKKSKYYEKTNNTEFFHVCIRLFLLCSWAGTSVYGQNSNMTITAASGAQQSLICMGAGYTQDPQNYSRIPLATRLAMANMIWGNDGLGFRICRLWQNSAGTLTGAQMLSDYLTLYNDINSVQTNMIWLYAAWGDPGNSPSNLDAYAAYHAQVIADCKAGGLVFQYVGTCNEPNGSTPFLYQSTNAAALVEDFRTELDNRGLTNVQIISPESPNVDSTGMAYITNIVNDPAALADLAAFCSHSYNMSFTPEYYTLCNVPGKQSWQDESGANGQEDTNWTGTNAINDESLAAGCVARACNDFNFGCQVWMHFEACLQWDTNDNATRIMGYDPNTFNFAPFLKYYYYQQLRRGFKDGCVFRRSTSSDRREAVYQEMCLTYGDRPAIVGAAGQNPDGSWGLNVVNLTSCPDIRPGVSAGTANYQPAATYNITYRVAELTNAGTVAFNLFRSNTNLLDVYQGTVLMTNGSVAFTIAPLELVTLVSAPTNIVGNVFKANNSTNLDFGASWVGGVAPAAANIAIWDSTVTGANTVSMGGNLSWGGISISNVGGAVTINPGNTLTLGAAGIDLSDASANLTLNCGLALGAPQAWTTGPGLTLTVGGSVANGGNGLTITGVGNAVVNGDITGLGGLTNAASGTVTLMATNGYTGDTTVNAGTLVLPPGENGAGIICGSLAINSGAQVNADTDWALGWSGTSGVTSITINGGTLNLTGVAGMGGLEASNVTLGVGSITGNTFDWYGGLYQSLSTGPVLTTVAGSAPSVISSGFNLGVGVGENVILNVAQGTTSNGVDLLISGPISDSFGGGGITKIGGGTVALNGANTYTEPTVVSNGILLVNGALGTGGVTVEGGALGGVGLIAGPVAINGGGTLAIGGTGIGTLAISNTLTLNSGGASFMRITKVGGTATNDSVAGISTLTYNGTLTVTNLAGTPAVGDTFKLFGATGYTGNFAATNLPVLGSGLAWNWVPATGTLAVVATLPPPLITGFSDLATGGFSLTFSGSNGASYSIYTTTNLASPISSWTILTHGTFGAGVVTYTDTGATNGAQFYIIESQ